MENDLIRRSDALEKIQGIGIAAIAAYGRIKSIPAVDAVEVVRCRECIYRVKLTGECTNNGGVWGNDGYCSDGKRREDGDNAKHL